MACARWWRTSRPASTYAVSRSSTCGWVRPVRRWTAPLRAPSCSPCPTPRPPDSWATSWPPPGRGSPVGEDPTTRAVLDRAFEPVLALTAAYAARAWDPDGSFDGGFVNGDDVLAWIADDGRRRGDGAAVLVAHSTSAFATPRLADPAAAEGALLAALTRLLDVRGEPDETHVQRWTLAKPTGQREAEFQLSEELVGVCGDGWGAASKVEGAWLSGVRLGDALVSRLQG